MGNQSSREGKCAPETAGQESSIMNDRERTRPGFDGRGCQRLSSPRLPLDQEILRSSLRKQGLIVAESDLRDVLANHTNHVEALSHLVESGRARRAATAQRTQRSPVVAHTKMNGEENGHLQIPDVAFGFVNRSAQKRARSYYDLPIDEADAEPTGRPMKRPVNVEDSEFARVLKGSGLGKILTNETSSEFGLDSDSHSTAMATAPDSKDISREASEAEERVLAPVQPGSPLDGLVDHFQDKQRPGQSSSPASPEAGKFGERTLTISPKNLNVANIKHTMYSAVERWAVKTLEEKNEAVRTVKNSLCLVEVGPQRKEELDSQLSRCIEAALKDLSDASDVKAGAALMGSIIQATRSHIHESVIEICERYSVLLEKNGSRDSAAATAAMASEDTSNDSHRPIKNNAFIDHSQFDQRPPRSPAFIFGSPFGKSPSLESSRYPQSLSAHELWSPFSSEKMEREGLFPARLASILPEQPHSAQPSRAIVRARRLSARRVTAVPTRAAQKSPEEEVYWIASNVCQEALRKAKSARSEVEWLQRQVDVVRGAAESIKVELERESQRQEMKVKKCEEDLQRASGEVKDITRSLIDKHVESSLSKEEAVLSFLSSLNGDNDEGDKKIRARARAIAQHKAANAFHRQQSSSLLLTTHAVKIGEVLRQHLFGDFMDTLSVVKQRANGRRLSCQDDLKSTANHLLEKLKVAIEFLKRRKRVAEKKRDARIHTAMEDSTLFGEVTANGMANQTLINEMEIFMEQSLKKAKEIKVDSEEIWRRMQGDLPEEDLVNITDDAMELFSNESDFADSGVTENKPSFRFGMTSEQGNITEED